MEQQVHGHKTGEEAGRVRGENKEWRDGKVEGEEDWRHLLSIR